jgi:hypothetical protein
MEERLRKTSLGLEPMHTTQNWGCLSETNTILLEQFYRWRGWTGPTSGPFHVGTVDVSRVKGGGGGGPGGGDERPPEPVCMMWMK